MMINPSAELQSAQAAFNNGDLQAVLKHVRRIDNALEADCTPMVSTIETQANRESHRQDRLVIKQELSRIERRVERENN